MFEKGISPKTRRSLALLTDLPLIKDFYLAGGTACALHLGHRLSFDLDFFTPSHFDQKKITDWLRKAGKFKQDQVKKDALLGELSGIKISFFRYDYPLIGRTEFFDGIKVLSEKDLIAMKIDTISSRGTRRDFIDLYFLVKKVNLLEAFELYQKKFYKLDLNLGHTLRSLTYFTDADEDKMPKMLAECDWHEVKAFFLKGVPKVLDELVKKG